MDVIPLELYTIPVKVHEWTNLTSFQVFQPEQTHTRKVRILSR